MNRDDLLKRCVDRRVAHETSVVAVSHLFYVYLLSALKRGQQVEVPNFGTFGTRIVGVKRQRRMPYFEMESDLSEKVNERYRNLKTLLVGKYELISTEGEVEYGGKETPYDPLAERLGKEIVLDTYRELTAEQFAEQKPYAPTRTVPATSPMRRTFEEVATTPVAPPRDEEVSSEPPISKEKRLMPSLNLRGDQRDEVPPPPTEPEAQQDVPPEPATTSDFSSYQESRFSKPLVQILIGVLLLAAATYVLNQLGWIRFWGTKTSTPSQTEQPLPPVVQPPPQVGGELPAESTAHEPTPTPKEPSGEERKEELVAQEPPKAEPPKAELPKPEPPTITPPQGAGEYTLQVSSWDKRIDAVRMVSRLSKLGIDAYVADGYVRGRKWYRVRVGRYPSAAEAQAAASRVQSLSGNGVWVTKVN